MSVNGHYNRSRVLTSHNEATSISAIQQHKKVLALLQEGRADDVRAEIIDHVSKLNLEKIELIRDYPDYFTTEDRPTGPQVGKL